MNQKIIVFYRVYREQTKYNKTPLWFIEEYTMQGNKISCFSYKTKKEALQTVQPVKDFPIGNRKVDYEYQEIKPGFIINNMNGVNAKIINDLGN